MGYIEGLADAPGGVNDTKAAIVAAINSGDVRHGGSVAYTILPDGIHLDGPLSFEITPDEIGESDG
jgi:hypothetical protein